MPQFLWGSAEVQSEIHHLLWMGFLNNLTSTNLPSVKCKLYLLVPPERSNGVIYGLCSLSTGAARVQAQILAAVSTPWLRLTVGASMLQCGCTVGGLAHLFVFLTSIFPLVSPWLPPYHRLFYHTYTNHSSPSLSSRNMFQDPQWMPETAGRTNPDCFPSEHVSVHVFQPQMLCFFHLN